MVLEILNKKLEVDSRFWDQQSKQAIRGNIIRALIELITNSDDSYLSLESKGVKTKGDIIITFNRQFKKQSKLIVRDDAEGMALEKLVTVTGKYSGATSSLFEDGGAITRGMFGRGLKDTIMGLGTGKITSFNGGYINEVSLKKMNNEWRVFYPDDNTIIKKHHLKKYNVQPKKHKGLAPHATIVEIDISSSFKIPLFDTIYGQLCQHFALRRIVNNPNRNVTLQQIDNKGIIKKEKKVYYEPPVGYIVVDENLKPKYLNTNIYLEIYRCNVKLNTPSEAGPLANGGIIIESNNIPLDMTLCGEGGNPNANWFWGTAKCDKLIKMAKKDDSLISATRDGLNWDHAVNKLINEAIRVKLRELIKIEEEKSKKIKTNEISKDLQQKNSNALNELNKIAKKELEELPEGTIKSKEILRDIQNPLIPETGFGFVPEFAQIKYNKESYLLLRAKIPEVINPGEEIKIQSESDYINIKNSVVTLEPREDFPNIGECKIYLTGTKIGIQGVITAEFNGQKAEALVEVIIKKTKTESSDKQRKTGLFKDIVFDPSSPRQQRVVLKEGIITIASKAPSVLIYFEEYGGVKFEEKSYVMLAELISDAMCTYIAQEKIKKGDQILLGTGNQISQLQYQQYLLQSKYSHIIHNIYAKRPNNKSDNSKMAHSI